MWQVLAIRAGEDTTRLMRTQESSSIDAAVPGLVGGVALPTDMVGVDARLGPVVAQVGGLVIIFHLTIVQHSKSASYGRLCVPSAPFLNRYVPPACEGRACLRMDAFNELVDTR